jgi:hypothetical protein
MRPSQDFSSNHEDGILLGEDSPDDDVDSRASDTLSELSFPSTSSTCSKLVTPQCKADKRLQNQKLQLEDWDKMQTPSPVPKKRDDHIMALAMALKMAKEDASHEKSAEATKGQLPDHVGRL